MPFSQPHGVPAATYRLQLRLEFPFAQATRLLPYLSGLGVSHCYCSPILMSSPGSPHGYDVNDYRRIDSDLGGREALEEFTRQVQAHRMGVLLDFVPNHMGINGGRNPWWLDVLECGPHSPFAEFFDIDWRDLHSTDQARVLVPILDNPYGVVLEQGRFAIEYEAGEFQLRYESMRFPLGPRTYGELLHAASGRTVGDAAARTRLQELAAAFAALPENRGEDEPIGRRQRDGLKQQLATAVDENHIVRRAIVAQLEEINGDPAKPGSLERLDAIINAQHYRLAHWRTGVHEVNYRRFFAIDSLIGLRMENPRVFEEAHRLVAALVRSGQVNGLRIDHIDGLRNPREYLERLQQLPPPDGAPRPLYVVVEKILGEHEELDPAWPAHGTTGYEFIRQLAGIFVDPSAEPKFTKLYGEFTGERQTFEEVAYSEKRLVLDEMFANAVTHLGHQLAVLLSGDRRWRDITRHDLTVAVREIMAGLNVYRIYREFGADCRPEDVRAIEQAFSQARRRNPRRDPQPFTIVRDVLTGKYPAASAAQEYRESLWRWVLTWQQYTGAIMAKAVEDTAFYAYNRFIALNEVGGNPGEFGGPVANFHILNRRRRAVAPHSLLASSTHDTKLGEDARARLYVLSELADEWCDWVTEWSEMNRRHKTVVDGRLAPDANEEYRWYQTLLACWPMEPFEPDEAFRERLREHVQKAVNEAQRNTHWLVPNERWIEAQQAFIDALLTPGTGSGFLASFQPRAERLAHLGVVNSLAQLALKTMSPGVPDFYQGCELWNLSLVDPDNRRLVDWTGREAFAEAVRTMSWRDLLRRWRNGGVKLRLMQELLRFRNDHLALFQSGDYEPLEANGRFADRLVVFRRRFGSKTAIIAVPRLTAKLGCPPLGLVWEDTTLDLPQAHQGWCEVLTRQEYAAGAVLVADLFRELPVALLCSDR